MDATELKARTQRLSWHAIRLVEVLPSNRTSDVIGRQLLRAATSVGANYRAACRAKSLNDFVAKINTVEEEADETVYWLELLMKSELSNGQAAHRLLQEARELTAIFTASGKTAKRRRRPMNGNPQSAIRNSQ